MSSAQSFYGILIIERRLHMGKMIKCESCGKEIAITAKVCPHCGAKKKNPIYTKVWFWLIVAAIVMIFVYNFSSDETPSDSGPSTNTGNEAKVIEYQKIDIDTLEAALENNAAAAKANYKGKYLEVTGRLGVIDSDLSYIVLLSTTNEWDFTGVHCTLSKKAVKEKVMTLSTDQTIVVRGKITDVGEVLGFFMDIDEIIA